MTKPEGDFRRVDIEGDGNVAGDRNRVHRVGGVPTGNVVTEGSFVRVHGDGNVVGDDNEVGSSPHSPTIHVTRLGRSDAETDEPSIEMTTEEIEELKERLSQLMAVPDSLTYLFGFDVFNGYRQMAQLKMGKDQYAEAKKWIMMAELKLRAITQRIEEEQAAQAQTQIKVPNFNSVTGERLTAREKINWIMDHFSDFEMPRFDPYFGKPIDSLGDEEVLSCMMKMLKLS